MHMGVLQLKDYMKAQPDAIAMSSSSKVALFLCILINKLTMRMAAKEKVV
jgi:hypothetical protein